MYTEKLWATWDSVVSWLRHKEHFQEDWGYSKQHPKMPVY